jgi:predicted SAM-dependent methyltransferase
MTKIHIHKDEQANFEIPKYTPMSYDRFVNLENNSIESIYIVDILDYFTKEDSDVVLRCIHDKLIDSGDIVIQGPDFYQLLIAINFNKIQPDLGKQVIYSGRVIMHSMEDILSKVNLAGFECYIKKYINIFEYYVEFKKI